MKSGIRSVMEITKVPDLGQSEQILEIATEIALQVAEDLTPYSNELKERVQHIIANKQYVFLPLSESNDTLTLADQILNNWATEMLKNDAGIGIFDLGLLMDFLQYYDFEHEEWFRLVVALERVGYGVAPELGPYINDQIYNFPVHLFKFKSSPEQRTSGSGKYYTLLISFAIGFALYNPTNPFSNEYLEIMLKQMNSTTTLRPHEKELLIANFNIFQKNVVDANYVCKLLLNDFEFDSMHIKGAIKEYWEFDNSMANGKLFWLMIFYIALGFDYEDIPSDLALTESQRNQLFEFAKNLEIRKEEK